MGQYFNQPDFGTVAEDVTIVTKAQATDGTGKLNSACLYVGTGGDINVIIAGTYDEGGSYTPVTFVGVPSGSILPVIVDYVVTAGLPGKPATSASNIVALK